MQIEMSFLRSDVLVERSPSYAWGREERVRDELVMALELAVPLWIEKLRHEPWPRIEERAIDALEVIAFEKGSGLYYRDKYTAEVFNAAAAALACGSFCSGGVYAFGLHFEAKHEG